jgi:pyruvate/2-oxoglutarate dehydrogenase complex dihydrolipoamide acyltransferase (E2) component
MPIEILMPSTGGDMTEGNIARWSVKPGDAVRKDAVLLEIETDKALVEVPAPGDGVLATILSPDGAERVKAGAVIGLIAVGRGSGGFASRSLRRRQRRAVRRVPTSARRSSARGSGAGEPRRRARWRVGSLDAADRSCAVPGSVQTAAS